MNGNKGEEETVSSESNNESSASVGKKRSAPAPSLLPPTEPHENGAVVDEVMKQHASDEEMRWKNELACDEEDRGWTKEHFESLLPHTKFWDNKIKELRTSNTKNIIQVLRTIPHMQSELSDLEQFLDEGVQQQHQTTPQKTTTHDVLLATREELNANDREFCDQLPNENLITQFLHSKREQKIKERQQEIKEGLVDKLSEIRCAATETEATLNALASLSQAEGSLATQNTTDANQKRQSKIQRDKEVQVILKEEKDKGLYPSGPGRVLEMIINKCGTFTHMLDKQSLQNSKTSWRLARVSEVFQNAFASANFLNKQEKLAKHDEYKSKIKNSASTLKSRFRSAMEEGNNISDNANCNNSGEKLSFPGPTSHEVAGVQPIFMALLAAVADCVQLDLDLEITSPVNMANPPSPPKAVSEQKVVFGGEVRRDRKCDACVWKRGRYLVVMLDSSMQLTIEIKPGQRAAHTIADLRREARDQSLSHSAKSLQDSLRFADGAGVPSYITSVIGTMVYIEVFQLRLIDPGQLNSRVEMVSSGPLPLVSQDLYDEWFKSDQRYASDAKQGLDLKDMKNLIFTDADLSVDEKTVPLGLKALYTLMACSRQELVGPKWESVSTHLDHLLGTGTFGMVFKSKNNPDLAIKVSKRGYRYYIKNEAVILGSLAGVHDRPTSIPQLLSSGLLDVTIGGVSWKLPAITMKPIGQGIYPILLSNKSSVGSIIDCIHKDVSQALDFLHGKDISHNDVSDNNILLFHDEVHGNYRALLVDFGVASPMRKKRCGLTGTPPFVHRELHTKYEWFPVPEYDNTSLGFTLVVLLARGVIPWDNLSDRGPADDGVYENRLTAARRLLDEQLNGTSQNLSPDTQGVILDLINLDKKKYLYLCKCSSKTSCGNVRCGCFTSGKVCSVLCSCYDATDFICKNGGKNQQQDILAISNDPFERDLF